MYNPITGGRVAYCCKNCNWRLLHGHSWWEQYPRLSPDHTTIKWVKGIGSDSVYNTKNSSINVIGGGGLECALNCIHWPVSPQKTTISKSFAEYSYEDHTTINWLKGRESDSVYYTKKWLNQGHWGGGLEFALNCIPWPSFPT